MNKKLLIALGILIVLIVGLVIMQPKEQIIGEYTETIEIGENTVRLYSIAVYCVTSNTVKFKGSIYVTGDEPMAWIAGFKWRPSWIPHWSSVLVTTCNPGSGKTFYYTTPYLTPYTSAYVWRTWARRIDGQISGNGPYGPSFYIPCK